jgi:hypothetical protein
MCKLVHREFLIQDLSKTHKLIESKCKLVHRDFLIQDNQNHASLWSKSENYDTKSF